MSAKWTVWNFGKIKLHTIVKSLLRAVRGWKVTGNTLMVQHKIFIENFPLAFTLYQNTANFLISVSYFLNLRLIFWLLRFGTECNFTNLSVKELLQTWKMSYTPKILTSNLFFPWRSIYLKNINIEWNLENTPKIGGLWEFGEFENLKSLLENWNWAWLWFQKCENTCMGHDCQWQNVFSPGGPHSGTCAPICGFSSVVIWAIALWWTPGEKPS